MPPDRWPFFYGWVILVVGALGILASIPGQTFGVSAFTESLLTALDLTRDQISVAYMLGTIGSALILTYAGRAYDRFGVRITAAVSCALMGCVLLVLSRVDRVAAGILRLLPFLPPFSVSFGVILVCFFVLRFSGQGVLTMVSRNMMMKWFDRHRGLVTGISGFLIAPLFSSSPYLLNLLVEGAGWRQAWLVLGLIAIFGMTTVIVLFFRDNPEAYGLRPDGPLADRALGAREKKRADIRPFSLEEARRTATFWIFAVGMSLFGMYMTGLSFHAESIFVSSGYTAQEGFGVFFPGAVVSILLRPLVGWCADRYALKYLLMFMMAACILAGAGILILSRPLGVLLLIAGNGLAGSAIPSLMSVTWPNFYGRDHLGAISGLAMSITVFSSALGPLAFSLIYRFSGHYDLSGAVIIFLACIIAIAVFPTRHPQERS